MKSITWIMIFLSALSVVALSESFEPWTDSLLIIPEIGASTTIADTDTAVSFVAYFSREIRINVSGDSESDLLIYNESNKLLATCKPAVSKVYTLPLETLWFKTDRLVTFTISVDPEQ